MHTLTFTMIIRFMLIGMIFFNAKNVLKRKGTALYLQNMMMTVDTVVFILVSDKTSGYALIYCILHLSCMLLPPIKPKRQ